MPSNSNAANILKHGMCNAGVSHLFSRNKTKDERRGNACVTPTPQQLCVAYYYHYLQRM